MTIRRSSGFRVAVALCAAWLGAASNADGATAPSAGTAGAAPTVQRPAPAAPTPAAPATHRRRRSTATTRPTSTPMPTATGAVTAGDSASAGESMTLKGGQEGTVFKSLTVEGEDRVHLEFDRPELDLALDPAQAPGLDWGTARDVLDRTVPDAMGPMMQLSGRQPMPYLGRPWLAAFGSGTVASFHPDVAGVERWKLTIADSRGRAVTTFSGHGAPPRDLSWDGRASDGTPVTPGLTYSYVFEAYDRAGNKRNIVGKGFTVPAYRFGTPDGPVLTFCGDSLWSGATSSLGARADAARAPELLLEAASWLNQSERTTLPIRVTATARSRDQAEGLASSVVQGLTPLVLGGSTRLRAVTVIQPDAPGGGTVTIAPGK